MLMCLGLFVFHLKTAPFSQYQRQNQWRWTSQNRVNADLIYQFTGRGEEQFTLEGVLYPEITGGLFHLDVLRLMADRGEPYLLLSGTGDIHGYFIIEALQESHQHLLNHGMAQKIEFSLQLKRYAGQRGVGDLAPLIHLMRRLST